MAKMICEDYNINVYIFGSIEIFQTNGPQSKVFQRRYIKI